MRWFIGLENGKIITEQPKKLREFLNKPNTTIWLDFEKPSREDFLFLESEFGFHPLALQECTPKLTLPKIDDFKNYLFVVIHKMTLGEKTGKNGLIEQDCFLGKNYIVTIHYHASESIEQAKEQALQRPEFLERGPDFILHSTLENSIQNYFKKTEEWENELDEIENKILTGKTKKILPKILELKRNISRLKNSIGRQMDVVNRLARRDSELISEKAGLYFRSNYDDFMRLHTNLESLRDLITTDFDAYLSIISNNLNDIIKRLTIISIIFLPLTFLAGLYGMNFKFLPFAEDANGLYAMLGLMGLIAAIIILYFKKIKWL
ncbi:MAG: magnesium/cobalt transporter CorA [Candidatus Diapherotrites archaeon]|nr:magnesium/cobalt transporter CorA [Candidatus Diapherotrites archaeon]